MVPERTELMMITATNYLCQIRKRVAGVRLLLQDGKTKPGAEHYFSAVRIADRLARELLELRLEAAGKGIILPADRLTPPRDLNRLDQFESDLNSPDLDAQASSIDDVIAKRVEQRVETLRREEAVSAVKDWMSTIKFDPQKHITRGEIRDDMGVPESTIRSWESGDLPQVGKRNQDHAVFYDRSRAEEKVAKWREGKAGGGPKVPLTSDAKAKMDAWIDTYSKDIGEISQREWKKQGLSRDHKEEAGGILNEMLAQVLKGPKPIPEQSDAARAFIRKLAVRAGCQVIHGAVKSRRAKASAEQKARERRSGENLN